MPADDTTDRVLNAAEIRLRRAGFHGVSFRDLAADVGIKSASVHYHFPTKTDLGRAVIERYADRFLENLGSAADPKLTSSAKLDMLIAGFRKAAFEDRSMCLCGLLATERDGLPEQVSASVASYFHRLIDWAAEAFGSDAAARAKAVQTIAALEGALMIAHILGNPKHFDTAVKDLTV